MRVIWCLIPRSSTPRSGRSRSGIATAHEEEFAARSVEVFGEVGDDEEVGPAEGLSVGRFHAGTEVVDEGHVVRALSVRELIEDGGGVLPILRVRRDRGDPSG